MAMTQLTTRIVSDTLAGAIAKNDTLTAEEMDNNLISLSRNKLEIERHLSELSHPEIARTNLGLGSIATKDIPLAVSFGGTGGTGFAENGILIANGTSKFNTLQPGKAGQIIISNGSEWVISNPPGSIGTVYSVRGGPGLVGSVTETGELALGTPSTCSTTSNNQTTEFSHTHAIDFPLVDVLPGPGLVSSGIKSKTLTLGTPSTLDTNSRNFVTDNSHTHQVNFPVLSVNGQTGHINIALPNLDNLLQDVDAGDGLEICGITTKTLNLGKPSTLTTLTSNQVSATSHTHLVNFPVTSVNGKTGDVLIELDNLENIPYASTTNAGLVSTESQSFVGQKTFFSPTVFNPQNSTSNTVFIGTQPLSIPNVNLFVRPQAGQSAIVIDASGNVNSTGLTINKSISGDFIKFQYSHSIVNQNFIGSFGSTDGNSVYFNGSLDLTGNTTFNKFNNSNRTFTLGAESSPSPHFQVYIKPRIGHAGININATDHSSNIGMTINKLGGGDYIQFQSSHNPTGQTFVGSFGFENSTTLYYKGNINFKDGIFEFNKNGNIDYSFNVGQYDTIFDTKFYSAYIGSVNNGGPTLILNGKNINTSSEVGVLELAMNQTTPHYISFLYGSTNQTIGAISTNGLSVHYGTTSDYRLKKNIKRLTNAQKMIQSLRPIHFTWKQNDEETIGFLAHEVAGVVPDAVNGEKDRVSENDVPIYQTLDTTKLIPILTAGLQEAFNRIDMLENRIAMLMAEKDKK